MYIKLRNLSYKENVIRIDNIYGYILKNYSKTIKLFYILKCCKIKINIINNIFLKLLDIEIYIYPNIFKECVYIIDDIDFILDFFNDSISRTYKYSKKINEIIPSEKILSNYLDYKQNTYITHNIFEDSFEFDKLNEIALPNININSINIIFIDKLNSKNNIKLIIKRVDIICNEFNYFILIEDFEIIDNLVKSQWYKLLYKIDNMDPFLEIKINIIDSYYYSICIYLNGIIFNINQLCIDYVNNIISSNIFYRDLKKNNNDIYFSKIYINSLYFDISYKPIEVNIAKLLKGSKDELVNIKVIHNLQLNFNKINIFHTLGTNNISNNIFDIYLQDLYTNNWQSLLKIAPTKYIYNIIEPIYKLFDINLLNNKIFILILKDMGYTIVYNLSNDILESTTRGIVSIQTIIENINKKEDKLSKFSNAPHSLNSGLKSAYKSIKDGIKKINNNNTTIYEKIIEPVIIITEATSKTLMGIHSSINKKKKNINKNRYK